MKASQRRALRKSLWLTRCPGCRKIGRFSQITQTPTGATVALCVECGRYGTVKEQAP